LDLKCGVDIVKRGCGGKLVREEAAAAAEGNRENCEEVKNSFLLRCGETKAIPSK
jgi:hypothetical protein